MRSLNLQAAEFDVLLTKIGVQEQALIAYWNWDTRGRQLQVFEELLNLALVRQKRTRERSRARRAR